MSKVGGVVVIIKVMSRAQVMQFSFSEHHEIIAVISISDCDKDYPHLENNPYNDIVYKCKCHFDDVDDGEDNCITYDDALKIASFVFSVKDKADLLIVHCEAGISRSAGVAAAIMKFIDDDDTPIFDDHHYRPNMTCYRKVLRKLFELCEDCLP